MGQSSRAFQEWEENHAEELYEEFAQLHDEEWQDFLESKYIDFISGNEDEMYERWRDDQDMNKVDTKQEDKAGDTL